MDDDDGVPCCQCCVIISFVVAFLIIIVGIPLLICFGIVPAHDPSIHVTDASLTPPDTTHHHYQLALNFTIRNRSGFYKTVKTYNKDIKLVAFCSNNLYKPIGTAEVLPFVRHKHKEATFTAVAFKGEEEEDDFQACGTSKDGFYDDIVVKVYISDINYMAQNAEDDAWQSESDFECDLKVPLITGADDVHGFKDTKCKSTLELFY